MKRLVLVVAMMSLLAPAALVFAKGHVAEHRDQVCHRGRVITIAKAAEAAHLRHGDVRLPKNDPDNIFFTGDTCTEADEEEPGIDD